MAMTATAPRQTHAGGAGVEVHLIDGSETDEAFNTEAGLPAPECLGWGAGHGEEEEGEEEEMDNVEEGRLRSAIAR